MGKYRFISQLRKFCGGWLKEDVDLRPYSYLKTGGRARYFIEASDEVIAAEEGEENLSEKTLARLRKVVAFLREEGNYVVLGKGSNVIIKDGVVDIPVLHLQQRRISSWEGTRASPDGDASQVVLRLPASLPLIRALKIAHDHHLCGMEFLAGIPGTVGGAVVMNAGVKERETKEVLHRVQILRPGGIEMVPAGDLGLSYRHSNLTWEEVVVQAEFLLKKASGEEILQLKKKTLEELEHRKKTQPLKFPSVGSTFKNPLPEYAGALIERCGLKNHACGGIKVSPIHANFIVNEGGGSSQEALRLIDFVQETVMKHTGIKLELEVRRLGFDRETVHPHE